MITSDGSYIPDRKHQSIDARPLNEAALENFGSGLRDLIYDN